MYDSDKCRIGSNHLEGRLMARAQRYFTRQTVIILVTLALLFGLAAGAVAANTRLVDADANLEKAYVLVDAARADGMEEMEGRAYDRALRRALADAADVPEGGAQPTKSSDPSTGSDGAHCLFGCPGVSGRVSACRPTRLEVD